MLRISQKRAQNLGAMSSSYSRAIEALDSLADSTEAFKASTTNYFISK